MGISFKGWPFGKDEIVYLHWLRSPYMVGKRKNWHMQAVFRKEDGSLQDVRVPWGALPALRLGRKFKDGKFADESHLGSLMRVRFDSSAQVSLCSAGSIPKQYELKTHLNLREKCVSISNNGEQIILPCLEVMRAYFAVNRMMAAELLVPDKFGDICTATLEGDQAHLQFFERVAKSSISKEVAKKVALVLFDKQFAASWNMVWASAAPKAGEDVRTAEPANPLHTIPPALSGSIWEFRGLKFGNITLVLEIKRFVPAIELPFSILSFGHPTFLSNEGGGKQGGKGRRVDEPEDVGVGPEPKPPKEMTSPRTIKIDFTVTDFFKRIELIKIEEKGEDGGSGRGGNGGGHVMPETIPFTEGTLNEEGETGKLPAIEFVGDKTLNDLSPGFIKLLKALDHLLGVTLSLSDGTAPDGCCLPRLPTASGYPRPYIVVEIAYSKSRFFLLEVDGSDGHSLSTLAFAGPPDGQSITVFGESLLKKCISSGGHWDKEKLRVIFAGRRFEMVKHMSGSSVSWAHRIWRAGERVI